MLPDAHRLLTEGLDALTAAAAPTADDDTLLSALTIIEGVSRRLDQTWVAVLAELDRRGTFPARGYRSAAAALGDLLGCDRADARRRLTAADTVRPRIGLDGTPLPPRLPATSAAFEQSTISLRHVEVVARLLDTPAAGRLTPDVWAGAEEQLAAWAQETTPTELAARGTQLIEALDADGPEPDDDRRICRNELGLQRHAGRGGGTLSGRYDDAAMFDAVATFLDAQSKPSPGDERTPAQRQAHALADACGYFLEHTDVPESGGHRPVLNVHLPLEDLEARCRGAVLDFAGSLSPESLRMLACDAAVAPIVLDSAGQPLDVGRTTRIIPTGLRRAVAARDRGCARCGKPPSWCEIHHIWEWQRGGPTRLDNLVMLCKPCHRLVHHAGWTVTLTSGVPTFAPPALIDPSRRPRGRTRTWRTPASRPSDTRPHRAGPPTGPR